MAQCVVVNGRQQDADPQQRRARNQQTLGANMTVATVRQPHRQPCQQCGDNGENPLNRAAGQQADAQAGQHGDGNRQRSTVQRTGQRPGRTEAVDPAIGETKVHI